MVCRLDERDYTISAFFARRDLFRKKRDAMKRSKKYLIMLVSAGFCLLLSGCLTFKKAPVPPEPLRIKQLVSRAVASAAHVPVGRSTREFPWYFESLLEDGRITIGLGIGTKDLGRVGVPDTEAERVSVDEYVIQGRVVSIESRLILTRDDFRQALSDCEIVFLTSHSRFGAGPVFLLDGKDKPYRMQRTDDYEIVMPESEVSGYQGTVKRTYRDDVKKRNYTVFEPDSTELDASQPLPGYQMMVFSTCTSKKHFLDEIAQFRFPYPTTAVFTTRACLMDTSMRVFMRMLYGLFSAQPMQEVISGMNEEYKAVAWKHVIEKKPPWTVIENLYTLGIHTAGSRRGDTVQ